MTTLRVLIMKGNDKMSKDDLATLIAKHFFFNAKGILDTETYDRIYSAALGAAKVELLPKAPTPKPLPNVPHISERLEQRYEIEKSEINLKELAALIAKGAPNITIKKNILNVIQEIDILYKGKIITILYNKTTNKLVTALPPKKKKKKKLKI